jgi:hypothetical protein
MRSLYVIDHKNGHRWLPQMDAIEAAANLAIRATHHALLKHGNRVASFIGELAFELEIHATGDRKI